MHTHAYCAVLCCAGGEFAEAVHYVANVWLPAKQVRVLIVRRKQVTPDHTSITHSGTQELLGLMLLVGVVQGLLSTTIRHSPPNLSLSPLMLLLCCHVVQVVAAAVREREEVDPSGAIIVLKV